MAHDILCRHCGHSKDNHDLLLEAEEDGEFVDEVLDNIPDSKIVIRGCSESLKKCDGYEPENSELAKK